LYNFWFLFVIKIYNLAKIKTLINKGFVGSDIVMKVWIDVDYLVWMIYVFSIVFYKIKNSLSN